MIFDNSTQPDNPAEPVMIPHHQDRLLKAVLVGTIIAVLLCASIAIMSWNNADDTDTIRNGTDLQGCRALYSSSVTAANSDAIVIVLQGLVRVATNQPLDDLVAANDRAQKHITDATNTCREVVELSISDPRTFLANCKSRTP